jgi:transcriptional regulator with XRE-family HTH domain
MTFADRLRACMEAPKKISQQELAAACSMTQATVSRLLNGQEPKSRDLLAIARFFQVPMEWLMTGENPSFENVKVAEAAVEYKGTSKLTKEGMVKIYDALEDLGELLEKMKSEIGNRE